jgi:hypothetical protein
MATNDRDQIELLLRELTTWRRASMPATADDPSEFKSTGESNAAIESLQQQLDRLGARYHWSEEAQEYRLDSRDPSAEHQGASDEQHD